MKAPKYDLVDIGKGVDAIRFLDGRYSGIIFSTETVNLTMEPSPDGSLPISFDILIHSTDDSKLTIEDLKGSEHFYAACAAVVGDIIDDMMTTNPNSFLQTP